jgi:hypothetical protein
MFVLHNDRTIYATRGDAVYFPIEKKMGDAKYMFQPEDIVRFKVFAKKNPAKVVLCKDFVVESESTSVNIFLGKNDMKFGEIISKPVDYWYEVELNPDTYPDTFIGYNEEGPAIFKLFPEAKDVVEGEIPDPEEESAVGRMVVTFVNEYMGTNFETMIQEAVKKYMDEHNITGGGSGSDGSDGSDGNDGADGANGVGIDTVSIDADGNLKITFTDGETVNVGRVVGADGKDGKNGVDGKTPVKGKDYYTEAEGAEFLEALRQKVPVSTAEDGYTDIGGLRQPKSISMVKSGSTITVEVIKQGDKTNAVEIALDDNGYPLTIKNDEISCVLTWEGFEGVV